MISVTGPRSRPPSLPGLFLASPRDGWVLGAAVLQGAITALLVRLVVIGPASLLVALGASAFLAIGVWWGSNTIAHIQLHTPVFRSPVINRAFSLYLTLLLRIPQTAWLARHMTHHHPQDRASVRPFDSQLTTELFLILAAAIAAVLANPFLLAILVLGQALGLGLCFLQGFYEHHHDAEAVDHHGRVYNGLWFNDGYHLAHHRWPGRHWSTLPAQPLRTSDVRTSAWPPILRWVEDASRATNILQAELLDRLERRILRSRRLKRMLVVVHRRSLEPLLARVPPGPVRIGVVGGGLFPRTVLVLRALRPDARIAIIDSNPVHLRQAREQLGPHADDVELVAEHFPTQGTRRFDVIVIPLAYRGERDQLYRHPPAPVTLIHDWIWHRRGNDGRRVSWLLLKRVNLVVT